jgi:hypothetical protein
MDPCLPSFLLRPLVTMLRKPSGTIEINAPCHMRHVVRTQGDLASIKFVDLMKLEEIFDREHTMGKLRRRGEQDILDLSHGPRPRGRGQREANQSSATEILKVPAIRGQGISE